MTDDERVGASTRALIESKIRLDDAVEDYTQAHGLSAQQTAVAKQRLHSAVIGFFWRMRPHIYDEDCWDSLEFVDAVDSEYIYQGELPQTGEKVTISGLRDLHEWIDRTETIDHKRETPLSSSASDTKTVRLTLPPAAAMRAAKVLGVKFEEFGWDARREYDDPVDEPTIDDLEELLSVRGQDAALENLPGRDGQSTEARADGGERE